MTKQPSTKIWCALIVSASLFGVPAMVSAAPTTQKAADKATGDKPAKANEKEKAPAPKAADQANDDDADDAAAKAGEKDKTPAQKPTDKPRTTKRPAK